MSVTLVSSMPPPTPVSNFTVEPAVGCRSAKLASGKKREKREKKIK